MRESLSPLWPFRLVTAYGRPLYLHGDGALFGALTTSARGI